ncbi:MAG: ATP-binding cassette domain-containing protein [Bacteriovoracaceae bacterium]|nr:ATP-binding cassette domain-containing protein [Bacteriovoracaceae bacterium]
MIEVKNLKKVFGEVTAVDDISFKVKKGEVLGFLGPNGAGKSTTMKIISCFIAPTAGDVLVCGDSIMAEPIKIKEKIGYMPENAPLYAEMTVGDFLTFVAEMRGIDKMGLENAVHNTVELCGLCDVFYRPIEMLSKGYKKRVSMAQAFIHDPEILILDEPTDGLDPNQKHEVRELIKQLSKDKCIILSTHILEEVEAICTRAIIISEGKIRYNGTPVDLKSKSTTGVVHDVFRAITTGAKVQGVTL